MFDDPLMRRELSGMARRWTTFAVRALLGLAMAWVILEMWRTIDRHGRYGDFSYGLSELARFGRQTFLIWFSALMVGLPLAGVVAAADLIPREVRSGTLGLLFLTPLTPWRMALGKWKAAMAQVLLLFLSGGPLAAVCAYLNGIETLELLWGTALPLASAAFATSLALAVSTFVPTAALTVVVTAALLIAGWAVPGWIFLGGIDTPGDYEVLGRTHPAFMAMFLVEPRRMPPGLLAEGWISSSALSLLASGVLLRGAAARLPGRLAAAPGPGLLKRLMGRLDRFYEAVNVGGFRVLARGAGVWESRALLWKELRLRAAGRFRHAARLGLALLVVMGIVLSGLVADARGGQIAFLWLMAGLLVLQALLGGAALFVQEKEGRQWEVLLSTPLTAREIVASKLGGGLAPLLPTAVIGALAAGALALYARQGLLVWAMAALPVGCFVLFAYLLAAAASLRCASYRGAFGLTVVLLGVFLVGIPLLMRSGSRLAGHRWRTREILGYLNPAWHLEEAARCASWGDYGLDPRLRGFLGGFLLLYAGAGAAVLVWMLRRFDRLAGRA